MQKKIDRLNSGIQETLVNIRVIKSFVRGDYEEEKFKNLNEDLCQSSIYAVKIAICSMPVMMLAMNITDHCRGVVRRKHRSSPETCQWEI